MATNADLYAVHRYQRITVLARCTGITEQLRPGIAGPGVWMTQPDHCDPTPAPIRSRERHRRHRVNALTRVLRWRYGPGG